MHYLDHAATTPVLPEVKDAVVSLWMDDFGNASSVHSFGRKAKEAVEDARDRVAAAIGCSPAEVVFTGGGTEADNLALKGVAAKLRGNGDHVVVSAFEHHAVLDAAEWLRRNGLDVSVVPPEPDGIVDAARVAAAVTPRTLLVSVMTVNN